MRAIALCIGWLALLAAAPARADEIEVRDVRLRAVEEGLVVDRTVTFADADYEAAVRMRLDTTLLPKPFQLSALTSRELQLDSPWKRFTVRPRQLPAPVESREPRQSER